MEPLPLTAILVSRNEADGLARALPTLDFCAEVIVVDLESDDATAEIAAQAGAQVLRRPLVASVERARAGLIEEAAHDWVVLTDPDMEYPEALRRQVRAAFPDLAEDVGVVYTPIQYFFGERLLRGTVWGGVRSQRLLIHRSRNDLRATIYSEAVMRIGYRAHIIEWSGDNAIAHRWVSGFGDFLAKHRRYVRVTAEDRAAAGEVSGWRTIVTTPPRRFVESYLTKRGYRDGVLGLALSVLWAWYCTASELALHRRLRRTQ